MLPLKPQFVSFSYFCGINTPTTANLKLPMVELPAWKMLENITINSCGLIIVASPNTPLTVTTMHMVSRIGYVIYVRWLRQRGMLS